MADYLVLDLKTGPVKIKLRSDLAPNHVERIKTLAGQGFYDGVVFHRVIPGFMAQTGDPTGTGTGGPGYEFANEYPTNQYRPDDPALQSPVIYPRGTLAMANAGPGTNGSQFFVTVAATPWLNRKHTIFGEVADQSSRDVVDAIATTATGAMDRPVDPVVIESVEIAR